MSMTAVATIIGGLVTLGLAITGAAIAIKQNNERKKQEAERRRLEQEERIRKLENRSYDVKPIQYRNETPSISYIQQPTVPSTVSVNHYIHGSQAPVYAAAPPMISYQQPQQTYNPPQTNYYANQYYYNDDPWKGEKMYGSGAYSAYGSFGQYNPQAYSGYGRSYGYAYG